jgi:hypothetical protein
MLQLLLMRRELDVAENLERAHEKARRFGHCLRRISGELRMLLRSGSAASTSVKRSSPATLVFAWPNQRGPGQPITRLTALHDASGKIERTYSDMHNGC